MRDRAAVDVDDVVRQAQFRCNGQGHGGKGFIDLEAFDIGKRPMCTLERLLDGRDRTQAEHSRLNRAQAIGNEPYERLETMLLGNGPIRHDHGRCTAVDAGRIAGGDRPVATEGRLQFGESLERGIGAIRFIFREQGRTGFALQGYGDDLFVELALCLGQRKRLLRAFGPAILRLPAQLIACREIFGMPAGVLTGECVDQAVHQHAVMQDAVAHALAPAASGHQVRCAVHVLHAACNGEVDIAQADFVRCLGDGLGTGSAYAVDGQRRDGFRNACVDRCLARRVHLVAGLDDVAEHYGADKLGVQPSTFHCCPNHGGAKLRGRDGLQRAVECADGRPDWLTQHDFFCTHCYLTKVVQAGDPRSSGWRTGLPPG